MERWDFLAPWCAALRERIKYTKDANQVMQLWDLPMLQVLLPRRLDAYGSNYGSDEDDDELAKETEFLKEFDRVKEALALLAAVEHVDIDGFRYLLRKYCEADIGQAGQERFETVQARFVVTTDVGEEFNKLDGGPTNFSLVRLCGTHQREHASPEYQEAIHQIAALDPELYGDSPGVDITISVTPHFPGPEFVEHEVFENVTDIATAERIIAEQWGGYKRENVPPGSLRCTFKLEPIILDLIEVHELSNKEKAKALEALQAGNVKISRLLSLFVENDHGYDERLSRETLARVLQRVFDCSSHSENLDGSHVSTPLQLDEAEIYVAADITSDSYFKALCSAMVGCQTTQNVALPMDDLPNDEDRSCLWYQWMAYGLFSKRARACSSLRTISLHLGWMAAENVEAFVDILASDHPEEDLCSSPRGLIDERDATLNSKAPIRWRFNDRGQCTHTDDYLNFSSEISFVRTFSDDGQSEWVDALVPGVGRCQVKRRDLTFASNVEPRSSSALISLTLIFSYQDSYDMDTLLTFLLAVGPSLGSLSLTCLRPVIPIDAILRSCPNLEQLSLEGTIIDIEFNFREYQLQRGALAEVAPLNLLDIDQISLSLCSPNSLLASSVRRLRVRYANPGRAPGEYVYRGFESDLKPYVDILEMNSNLEYFNIAVGVEYAQYATTFRKYHQPLPRVKLPLPTESKLAFLSIFPTSPVSVGVKKKRVVEDSNNRLLSCELSPDVLSTIFVFAAVPVLREVYFFSVNGDPQERALQLVKF